MFLQAPRSVSPSSALLLLALAAPASTQSLETFVIGAGGQSACATFGTPAPVSELFGPLGVSEPILGYTPCNVDAGMHLSSAVNRPLSDALVFSSAWSTNAYDAAMQTRARYGVLDAAIHTVFSGASDSFTVAGADASAKCVDGFTFTSPSVAAGQVGFLRVLIEVQGSVAMSGNGVSEAQVVYRVGTGPVFLVFRAQAFHPAADPWVVSATGNGVSGFALAPGTASGSGVVDTLLIPFSFGTTIDFELGLLAYGVPSLSSTAHADFRARIVGFEVAGPLGQPVTDFALSTRSGASYAGVWHPRHQKAATRP